MEQARQKAEQRFFVVIACVAVLYFALSLVGCATTGPAPSAPLPPKYELTLSGSIDGKPFQGVGLGTNVRNHSINIQSAIAVDYFTVQSCHRSLQFNNVIKAPDWFSWQPDNRGFTWPYNEAPTIEDSGDCILRFCAFSKTVGSPPVSCALVDFKNTKYALPAENICNGFDIPNTGTSLCHTQVGLIERMRFSGPVVIAPQVIDATGKTAPYWIKDQCVGKFIDTNQSLFEYQVPEDECVIIFMEKAAPHRRAKLTVIPYTTAIYPGAN